MRIITTIALLLVPLVYSFARPVDVKTYSELMREAELVLIVHATAWRPATDDDDIVPIESDLESLAPIFTKFNVLTVLKGEYDGDTFELCHYRYTPFSRRIGNGPLLAWFDTAENMGASGYGWVTGRIDNDFVLFLKRDEAERWTFITGQYDAELSVRQITSPIRPGTTFGQ